MTAGNRAEVQAVWDYVQAARVTAAALRAEGRGEITEAESTRRRACKRPKGTCPGSVALHGRDTGALWCLRPAALEAAPRLQRSPDPEERRAFREFRAAVREVEKAGEQCIRDRERRALRDQGRLF